MNSPENAPGKPGCRARGKPGCRAGRAARKVTQESQQHQGHLLVGRVTADAGVAVSGAGAGRPWAAARPGSAVTGVTGQAPGGTGVYAGTLKLKLS